MEGLKTLAEAMIWPSLSWIVTGHIVYLVKGCSRDSFVSQRDGETQFDAQKDEDIFSFDLLPAVK